MKHIKLTSHSAQDAAQSIEASHVQALLLAMPEVDKLAWSIARQIARFHCGGRIQLRTRGGKKISKGQAKASGRKVRAETFDGTGGTLSACDMEELHLSARASLMAEMMQGATLRGAWRKAASCARRTLYVIRREPFYDSAEKAARAHDRAYRTFASTFDMEAGGTGQAQPNCAEFIAGNGEEYFDARTIALRAYKRAKVALRARYAALPKTYNALHSHFLKDLASLRYWTREIIAGTIQRKTQKDDPAEYKRIAELGAKVQSGKDALALASAYECASAPAPAPKRAKRAAKVRTMTLPGGFIEHWHDDLAHNLLPLAARVLGNVKATRAQVESLAALFAVARH